MKYKIFENIRKVCIKNSYDFEVFEDDFDTIRIKHKNEEVWICISVMNFKKRLVHIYYDGHQSLDIDEIVVNEFIDNEIIPIIGRSKLSVKFVYPCV